MNFEDLPQDIFICIGNKIKVIKQIINLGATCKKINSIIKNGIWDHLCISILNKNILKAICIYNFSNLSFFAKDEIINTLIEKRKNIKYINCLISKSGNITDENLNKILIAYPNLSGIKLNCCKLSDETINKIICSLPKLHTLGIYGSFIRDETLKKFRNIRIIDLGRTNITDTGIISLCKNNPKLCTLSLIGTGITDNVINTISKYNKHLRFLNVTRTLVTDKYISKLTRLQLLVGNFTSIKGNNFQNLNITDLRLPYAKVDDIGLTDILKMKYLQILKIGKTSITDVGISNIPSNRKFKEVDIYCTCITNKSAPYLKNIVRLNLKSTLFTDTGVLVLCENNSNLKHLSIGGKQYRSLVLMDITDESISQLTNLKSLNMGFRN
jgi:hypothetical protein